MTFSESDRTGTGKMETIRYELRDIVPHSQSTGVDFVRLEMPRESSPLALVWYTNATTSEERGSRIDLHKQAFLDDFGNVDRSLLSAEAKLIVNFVNSRITSQRAGAFGAGW